MTVYTVIGHITNAILTFDPLQIRSNLSGGPQLHFNYRAASMTIILEMGPHFLVTIIKIEKK